MLEIRKRPIVKRSNQKSNVNGVASEMIRTTPFTRYRGDYLLEATVCEP